MAIRIERSDMVATIVMDRPEARNAVDGPAAGALIEAFEAFERDDALRVAVLWGAGGTFCAGADLKARGTERGLRLTPDGHGPMGPPGWRSPSRRSPPSRAMPWPAGSSSR
jgi:enoyl-CoA hydratase